MTKRAIGLFVLLLALSAPVGAQKTRVELSGSYNFFGEPGGGDYSPQFFAPGLRLEALVSNHWGFGAGINYGRWSEIFGSRPNFRRSANFIGLEPSLVYHSSENMSGFMAEFVLRAGMQQYKEQLDAITLIDTRYFHVGPEIGLGYNAYIANSWMIGGRAGLGLFVGDIGYARISGGISVSKVF